MRHAIAVIGICAVVALAGCNLREYQERMDIQAKRLETFDTENRLLSGSYLAMPLVEAEKKEGTKQGAGVPAWPFEIFLRPPREFKTVAEATVYEAPTRDVRLFRYMGNHDGTYSLLVAAAVLIGDEKTKDGKHRRGEFTVREFRERVHSAAFDYYRKEYNKISPPSTFLAPGKDGYNKVAKVPVNDRGENLPPIEFDAVASRDTFNQNKETGTFELYFHHEDLRQVAILVQFPSTKENDNGFREAEDWSLKSLEVNQFRVMEKRSALNRRR